MNRDMTRTWRLVVILALALGLGLGACETSEGDDGADPGDDTSGTIGSTGGVDTSTTDETGAADVPYGTPKVEIIQPIDGEVLLWGVTVLVEATVVDADDVFEDLVWNLTSNIDGIVAENDGAESWLQLSLNDLSGGTHHLTLTVTDPAGRVGQDSIDLTLNRVPGDDTVLAIAPEAPTTADALDAVVVQAAFDPDGTTPTYNFTWYVDEALAGVAGENVSSALTTRGEVWRVVGVPTDGHASGGPAEQEQAR